MKVDFVIPFVQAAREVLEAEVGGSVRLGEIGVRESKGTAEEVTALVGVTGMLRGIVMYGMSEATAKAVVARMCGEVVQELDWLAQSAIAELGNVITGRASTLLAERSLSTTISPPVLITGRGTSISTLDIKRLAVSLATDLGDFDVEFAMKETSDAIIMPAHGAPLHVGLIGSR